MLTINYTKRIKILYKLKIYFKLKLLSKNHPRGQLKYAFDYLLNNIDKFIEQGKILSYCDYRRNIDTNGKNPIFKDNSRQLEKLRKELYPLSWIEVIKNGNLYFKYSPIHEKNKLEMIYQHSNNFSRNLIKEKLKSSNYKCSITGIPQDNGGLAADHFIPKEKGGINNADNCIIINKILNEKKNKKMPIEWFCETILTNFMYICKQVGILEDCKDKLIKFIQEY